MSGDNHDQSLLVDSLAVLSLLEKMDPSITIEGVGGSVLNSSSNQWGNSLEKTLGFLSGYLGRSVDTSTRDSLHQSVINLSEYIVNSGKTYNFSIIDENSYSIARQNNNQGRAYRYSLVNLMPFVIAGSVLEDTVSDSKYDLNNYTSKYLSDRHQMLLSVIDRNNSKSVNSSLSNNSDPVNYVDQEKTIDFVTLPIAIPSGADVVNTTEISNIIFGHSNRNVNGYLKDDRLYGGDGGNTIHGREGDDYIEGRGGNDNIYGDKDNDTLLGGEGSDTFYFEDGDGVDRILDGDTGGDRIRINSIDLSNLVFEAPQGSTIYRAKNSNIKIGVTPTNKAVITYGSTDIGMITLLDFEDGDYGIDLADSPLVEYDQNSVVNVFTEANTREGDPDRYGIITTIHEFSEGQLATRTNRFAHVEYALFDMASFGYQSSDNLSESGYYGSIQAYSESVADNNSHMYATNQAAWIDDSPVIYDGQSIVLETTFPFGVGGDVNQPFIIFEGGKENDLLQGSAYQDELWGGKGDDQISGGAGDDILSGGIGNDYIEGNEGRDFIFANQYHFDLINVSSTELSLELLFESEDSTNTLIGGAGSDTVTGGRGTDQIYGGSEDDQLLGGYGSDILEGGEGYDVVFGDSRMQEIYKDIFRLPDDSVVSTPYPIFDMIEQPQPNDAENYTFNDVISGGEGDDYLVGEIGDDTILGGSDNDVIEGDRYGRVKLPDLTFSTPGSSAPYLTIEMEAPPELDPKLHGNDYIDGGSGDDRIYGQGGDDVLLGGSGDDTIWGDDQLMDEDDHGDDTLEGGVGDDTLFGGAGNDTISGDEDNDHIEGQDGNDNISGGEGDDQVLGGDGADYIQGNDGVDLLHGEDGNDTIFGNSGDDELVGGEGEDILIGGSGNDNIWGSNGDDILSGGTGNDILLGEAGNDTYRFSRGDGGATIHDSLGSSVIEFSAGVSVNDITIVQLQNDTTIYFSKDGNDYIALPHASFFSISTLNFSDGTSVNPQDLLLEDSDTAYGSAGDNTIAGKHKNETIYGGDGNDTLTGGGGEDKLYGEGGDDILRGDSGDNDLLSGGDGNDVYLYGLEDGDVTIDNSDGDEQSTDILRFLEDVILDDVRARRSGSYFHLDIISTGSSITLPSYFLDPSKQLTHIEFFDGTVWDSEEVKRQVIKTTEEADRIYGFEDSETINGLGGDDYIEADAGDDTITGGDGDDHIQGDAGDDVLSGNDGDDYLSGGEGNDTLDGGLGNDSLSGGLGDDVYLYRMGDGDTTIYNYDSGADSQDTLKLAEILPSQIALTRTSDNLLLTIESTGHVITVNDFFRQSSHEVETVEFDDGTSWDATFIKQQVLITTDGDDEVTGYEQDDTIHGLDGNDRLYGAEGNDSIYGGNGDDQIYGNEGDDFLDGGNGFDTVRGGSGNDTLRGGSGESDVLYGEFGSDTYLFDVGDGNTAIVNNDGSLDSIDTLQFLENVQKEDLSVSRRNDTLIFTVLSSGEEISVNNFFRYDRDAIDVIKFHDGSVWSIDSIKEQLLQSTEQDDTIIGYESNDTISGGAGKDWIQGRDGDDVISGGEDRDRLYGQNGSDIIFGGDGNDTIVGGDGNDELEGEAGDDYVSGGDGDDIIHVSSGEDRLFGGDGSDTYIYSAGDGSPTIENDDSNSANIDKLVFDSSINPSEVRAVRREGDLTLVFENTDEVITITNYFYGSRYELDAIEFSDGTSWDPAAVQTLVDTPTEGDDYLYGNSDDNAISGNGGSDELYGYDGDDALTGGAGNDSLEGGTGNDTYLFSRGGGVDVINDSSGTDSIEFTDVLPTEVVIRRIGSDLVITVNGESDQITVKDHFDGERIATTGNSIESIKFSDNTEWLESDIYSNAVTGSAQDDEILGFDSSEDIHAGDGDDRVTGYDGDDIIHGESGNDVLFGGDGNDSLYGGEGNDYVYTSHGDDQIFGDEGSDNLEDLYGDNVIHGGQGDDVILGRGDLYGDEGADDISGHGSLDGGSGNDTLDATQASTLSGGTGDDTLDGSAYNDIYKFNLGDGVDVIIENDADSGTGYQGTANDTLRFGSGINSNDLIFERIGTDLVLAHINGSDQVTIKDWYAGSASQHKVENFEFDDGSVLLTTDIEKLAVLNGTAGDDSLIGYQDNDDTINGLAGDDQIWGNAGNDSLSGGTGADYLDGGEGDDQLVGGDGADNLQGKEGSDQLQGGDGNDYLHGGSGNDDLQGGAGDDQLRGGEGDDNLVAGAGDDTVVIEEGDGHDVVELNDGGSNGIAFTGSLNSARLSFTQDGDDLVILVDDGSAQSIRVKDHFLGGESSLDWVSPSGEVTLSTTQINTLASGEDPDSAGGNGGGEGEGSSNPDDYDSVNQGTSAGEQLLGTNSSDLLQGLGGDDQIFAFGGNDRLEGGDGNDYLSGGNGSRTGSGDDTLIGGEGNDTLVGEDGNDILIGGNGNDHYYYYAGTGQDVIKDDGDGQDVLFFNDVAPDRLSYHQDGNDLIVLVDGDLQQQVRVVDHFLGGNHEIMVQPNGGYTQTPSAIASQLTDLPGSGGDGGSNPDPDPDPDPTPDTGNEGSSGNSSNTVDLSGDDIILGSSESELLVSGAGDDSLSGLEGDDQLFGGAGNDTYLIGANSGQDTVVDVSGTNTIRFVDGITFSQVASGLLKSGNDLVLRIGSTGNQVRISNFFSLANTVNTVEFESGGQFTASQVFGAFGLSVPTTTQDEGDLVLGDGADNTLTAGASNDILISGKGDDTLSGLEGDDRLFGGEGNDTYLIGDNNGVDTVIDASGQNVIRFVDGIGFSDVASGLQKSGNDLILRISGSTSNQVRVSNFFSVANTVDTLEFESGGQITAAQLFGAFGLSAPTATGTVRDILSDTFTGTSGDDQITGTDRDETITGSAGNDTIDAGGGSDRIFFGEGDGQDVINQLDTAAADANTDTLVFDSALQTDELWFSRNGNSLQINIVGTDDQVTINDWYNSSDRQLDTIEVGSAVLLNSEVDQLVNAMAGFDVPDGAGDVVPDAVKQQLEPTLTAVW